MAKIAIDGPAGAGKSTISKLVAQMINYDYIDTGAMYRAVTLKAIRLGINLENEAEYDFLKNTEIDVAGEKIFLDGVDVSEDIRSVQVTNNASTPAKLNYVRETLVALQRKISQKRNVIMDGRDIGTVVFPNAELKIYLDASLICRAERRMLERIAVGINKSLEETMEEIRIRDYKDSTRAIAPLKKADDAILIDTSNMEIDEVVSTVLKYIKERGLLKMNSEKRANYKYLEGQEVTGVITNVTKEAIYCIIDGEEKAVIYANDLANYAEGQKLRDSYSEGGEFTGLVKQLAKDKKTGEPLYILSTKLYQAKKDFPKLEELKENEEIIKAKVVSVNDHGADLQYKEFRFFMPLRNIDLDNKALRKLVGEVIEVVITHVNPERLQVIVSNTFAINKKNRMARDEAMSKLEVGQIVHGTVTNILEFGAIVDLGHVTGLLHRTEIDHKLVKNVNDYLKIGDELDVKIIKLEDGKIGLSHKALIEHPWETLKAKFHVGDIIDGEVVKEISVGLIIKLTDDYSGLMPWGEYSWFNSEKAEGKYHVGDVLKLKVINIDDQKRRISLSRRALSENAWNNIQLKKGDTIQIEVVSMVEKGANVRYQEVIGFMPISEVTAAKRIAKVEEIFKIGDVVDVVVLEFDPRRPRLSVSAKALEEAKERENFNRYFAIQEAETPVSTMGDIFGAAFADFISEDAAEEAPKAKKTAKSAKK